MSQTEMQHTDSMSSNDNGAEDSKKTKSRRPASTITARSHAASRHD